MSRWVALLGLVVLVGVAILLSNNKKQIDKRLVFWGLGLQIIFAVLILGIPALNITGPISGFFRAANNLIVSILNFTDEGSQFLFGSLVDVKKVGFVMGLKVLPTIVFMASLMAVLYHLGVMQKIVRSIAWGMQRLMGVSGAESLSVAANIFVGQTEAPLVVKPYVEKMTQSELFVVMVGGMATVAGGVLAAYVGLLKDHIPEIAGHLLAASVMSAPAALAIAKIMYPETETPVTLGGVPAGTMESEDYNIIEAAARGAGEGLSLALNVGAMLLAFIALIALVDGALGVLGNWLGFSQWGVALVPNGMNAQLSLSLILGWVFAPLAFLMGIPWSESALAGALLGQKIVLNEFVAYVNLSKQAGELSERTVIILSYALCGFANFSSIAIQIGGIGGLAPTRRKDLAALGIKSIIAGSLAAFLTASIAGILL